MMGAMYMNVRWSGVEDLQCIQIHQHSLLNTQPYPPPEPPDWPVALDFAPETLGNASPIHFGGDGAIAMGLE